MRVIMENVGNADKKTNTEEETPKESGSTHNHVNGLFPRLLEIDFIQISLRNWWFH